MLTKDPRPFADLNTLCSGVFWQLPPPGFGFLGDIPCEFIRASRTDVLAPTVAHGQSSLWSDAPTGMSGMTELQQCERSKDVWLRSIQDSFRFGKLTEETHVFVHGVSTMHSGSIVNGNITCAEKGARPDLPPRHVV